MKNINNKLIWFIAIVVSIALTIHVFTYETPEEKFIKMLENSTPRIERMNKQTEEAIQIIDSITARTEAFNKQLEDKLNKTRLNHKK